MNLRAHATAAARSVTDRLTGPEIAMGATATVLLGAVVAAAAVQGGTVPALVLGSVVAGSAGATGLALTAMPAFGRTEHAATDDTTGSAS